jgi:hypothetical protein
MTDMVNNNSIRQFLVAIATVTVRGNNGTLICLCGSMLATLYLDGNMP